MIVFHILLSCNVDEVMILMIADTDIVTQREVHDVDGEDKSACLVPSLQFTCHLDHS